jgi:hypothetical protein
MMKFKRIRMAKSSYKVEKICLRYLISFKAMSTSTLPFELEQEIFENAARSDRKSALSLALVAQRVRYW